MTTTSPGIYGNDQGGAGERTITVQIIAASAVVRAGLGALIGADERFEVLGSFATARAAQDEGELAERSADLIIAELGDGLSDEIVERATTTGGTETDGPAVVALIPDWQQKLVGSLLRSGVSAVLPNTATAEEILAAVEAALAGLIVLSRDAFEIFEETQPTQETNHESTALDLEPLTETLTPRERQVLEMIAEGLGNKEIAWRLQISEHTVKFHVSSILGKLGASSRTEAVTQGLKRGLIMM